MIPWCLGASITRTSSAHPVPLGEVRAGGPGLLAVEPPSVAILGRLELHGGSVGSSVGLGVADGELDLVLEDLGEELLLQLVGAVSDDGLADDADALADLRPTSAGELLVEQVLIDTLSVLAAVLLGPGDAEPALLAQLGHELSALRRVDDLRHVLSRDVEDIRVIVGVEERLDLLGKGLLLIGELKIHGASFRTMTFLTLRQIADHYKGSGCCEHLCSSYEDSARRTLWSRGV